MNMIDPRINSIRYFYKGHSVRSRGDLSMFSPPLNVAEGRTGWCGWRTLYQVMQQTRNTFYSDNPPLSLDFIAAQWALMARTYDPAAYPDLNQIYGLSINTIQGLAILRTFGTVPFSMFGNGVRVPTPEENAEALKYAPQHVYEVPYFSRDGPDRLLRIAVVREIIDSGFVIDATCDVPPFLSSGGEIQPQPLGVVPRAGHVFTLDKYDDAGFNGAGLVGGSTNGIGRWTARYAEFLNYFKASTFIAYSDPPTYPFPPPGESIEPKNAARLVDDATVTMQEQLARIPYHKRDTTVMTWTFALVEQLEAIAKKAREELTTQPPPPVEPPPPPPPVVRTEYIINALPAGQAGPSGAGSVAFTGTWNNSTTAGRYLNDGLYSGTNPAPDATPLSAYTFRSPPLKAGNWEVYVWWAAYSARSQTVPITACGVTKNCNQQIDGSKWVLHGTYACNEGEQATVTISNANGQAAADAVRFVSV